MRKVFGLGFMAALVLCGCQEELEMGQLARKTFTADIEDSYPGGETKTSLDEHGNILWTKGDQVSIFAGSTVNEQYQVTDDSDGKTSASLNRVTSSEFVAGGEISANVAYYPYASGVSVAKNESAYVVSGIVLPSTQNYSESSFADGAFPMAAVTSSTSDMNLKFRNVLGGLKLQLKGTAKVASISVRGNANEVLCGAVTVAVSTSALPAVTMANVESQKVTLDCGAGVQLNSETATSFIIALPPVTMASGFTVTVTDTDGKQMEITTSKSQTITRSTLLKMPVVEYVGEEVPYQNTHDYVDLGIRKSLLDSRITPGSKYDTKILFAACNLGAESPKDYGYYFRWGELNGWKITAESGEGTRNILSAVQYDKNGDALSTVWSSETFSSSYALSSITDVVDYKGKTDLQSGSITYGDAATYNWGGPWRTPDKTLLDKLLPIVFSSNPTRTISNKNGSITLTYSFAEQNGVDGMLVENKDLGRSIFLPMSGFCEEGQLHSDVTIGNLTCSTPYSLYGSVYYVAINSFGIGIGNNTYEAKYTAKPVRPIAELTLADEIPDPMSLPVIGNVSIKDADYTTASVTSSLISDGNAITERGFYYGTSETSLTKYTVAGYDMGDFSKELSGLYAGTTYYIKAYATNEVGTVESELVTFTTKTLLGKGETTYLSINTSDDNISWTSSNISVATVSSSRKVTAVDVGKTVITATAQDGSVIAAYDVEVTYAWVDLGLPSGTLWAAQNLGYYFEAGGYTEYMCTNCEPDSDGDFDWCDWVKCSYYLGEGNETDVAARVWGKNWRVPTNSEYTELFDATYTTAKSESDGIRITSKANGNSIFFYAAGYGNINDGSSTLSHELGWQFYYITSESVAHFDSLTPSFGGLTGGGTTVYPIRAVRSK